MLGVSVPEMIDGGTRCYGFCLVDIGIALFPMLQGFMKTTSMRIKSTHRTHLRQDLLRPFEPVEPLLGSLPLLDRPRLLSQITFDEGGYQKHVENAIVEQFFLLG